MDNIRLACTAVRIVFYRLYKRMRGDQEPVPKPEISLLILGLDGSGKSTSLALLAGESLEGVEPTKGFHIKDVQLENSMAHCKEVGGSEKIRKYWHAYTEGIQGLVYMVNGISTDEELNVSKNAYDQLISLKNVENLPKLIIVTHSDKNDCKTAEQIETLFAPSLNGRDENTRAVSTSINDSNALRNSLVRLADLILGNPSSPDQVVINTEA